jgi:glutamate dehydrogenase
MMLDIIRQVKAATRWLLRNRRHQMDPVETIAEFSEGLSLFQASLPDLLRGRAAELFVARRDHYIEQGIDAPTASRVAGCQQSPTGLAIVDVAVKTGGDLLEVAGLYYHLGERLELDWFGAQVLNSKIDNEWQAMAREAYLEDLQWQQCTLTKGVMRLRGEGRDILACLTAWEEQEHALLQRWRDMLGELHATSSPDFAMLAVANRELLDLAQSTQRGQGTD